MRVLLPMIGAMLLMLAPGRAATPDPAGGQVDVAYGPLRSQRLDLCSKPSTDGGLRPGVVLIHGGSWFGGDKADLGALCRAFAQDGFVAASINYRLLNDADASTRWPAQLADAQLAIRWMRDHAHGLALDPSRLCAYGESAGGQLAIFLGTQTTIEPSDAAEVLPDRSPSVSCVVDIAGPADLMRDPPLQQVAGLLLGLTPPVADRGMFRPLSPLFLVGPASAPMFIAHGTEDRLVPADISRGLRDRLRQYRVPVTYMEFHGQHDWVGLTAAQRKDIQAQIMRFLHAAPADR